MDNFFRHSNGSSGAAALWHGTALLSSSSCVRPIIRSRPARRPAIVHGHSHESPGRPGRRPPTQTQDGEPPGRPPTPRSPTGAHRPASQPTLTVRRLTRAHNSVSSDTRDSGCVSTQPDVPTLTVQLPIRRSWRKASALLDGRHQLLQAQVQPLLERQLQESAAPRPEVGQLGARGDVEERREKLGPHRRPEPAGRDERSGRAGQIGSRHPQTRESLGQTTGAGRY